MSKRSKESLVYIGHKEIKMGFDCKHVPNPVSENLQKLQGYSWESSLVKLTFWPFGLQWVYGCVSILQLK